MRALAAALTACALAACATVGVDTAPSGPPADTRLVQANLLRYFECEECTGQELTALLALAAIGPAHREAIERSLIAALQDGPAPARRRRFEEHRANRLSEYLAFTNQTQPPAPLIPPSTVPLTEFLERPAERYDVRYRSRAATALGALGGDAAVDALVAAYGVGYGTAVDRAILDALVSL